MTSVQYIGGRPATRRRRRARPKRQTARPWRLAHVLTAFLVVAVSATLLLRCEVSSVRVFGGELVDLGPIQPELRAQFGSSLLLVDSDAIVELFERDPWVNNARVDKNLPGELRVIVEASSACLRLEDGGAVAADGRILPVRREVDLSALPLLRRDSGRSAAADQARLAELFAALNESPWAFDGRLAEIHLESDGVVLVDGQRVEYQISDDRFARSLQRLAIARERLHPREGDRLDLRFERQIVLAPATARGREG